MTKSALHFAVDQSAAERHFVKKLIAVRLAESR